MAPLSHSPPPLQKPLELGERERSPGSLPASPGEGQEPTRQAGQDERSQGLELADLLAAERQRAHGLKPPAAKTRAAWGLLFQRALQAERLRFEPGAAAIRWLFARGNLGSECPFRALSPANLLSGDKLERVLVAAKPARSRRSAAAPLALLAKFEGTPLAELTADDRETMATATAALRAKLGRRPAAKVRRLGEGAAKAAE